MSTQWRDQSPRRSRQQQAARYEWAQQASERRLRRQRVAQAVWPYAAVLAAFLLWWALDALATAWTGVPG